MDHNRRRRRPPAISPSSPSRSWDDGDRPPSPITGAVTTRKQQSPRQIFRRVTTTTTTSNDHHHHQTTDAPEILRRSKSNEDSADPELSSSSAEWRRRSESPSSIASEPLPSYHHHHPRRTSSVDLLWGGGGGDATAAAASSDQHEKFAIASVDVAAEPQRTSPLGVPVLPTLGDSRDRCPSDPPSLLTASTEQVQRELHDKSLALDNAKRIIASLEKSIAVEWKRKVAARDTEVQRLSHDLAIAQKHSQALAAELREQQNTTAAALDAANTSTTTNTNEHNNNEHRRLRLSGRLDANLTEVRAAIVVLEATQDAAAVEHVTQLLADSADALREGIVVATPPAAAETSSSSDPYRVFRELELQTKRVRGLELSLQEQEEHYRKFRSQTKRDQLRREEESNALVAEIRILRQQCTTNMEVLTKKERELAVLRDSLRVEDDVGYISEDEDEEEVEQHTDRTATTPPADPSLRISSPTQMEALATLLATGGNRSFDSGSGIGMEATSALEQKFATLQAEVVKARNESARAIRDLKVEKESLSNAKMIISSLERANKSMMEDLRARLHDSQGAVASLLEKSLESEKTNAKLRAELDSVRRSHSSLDEEDHAVALGDDDDDICAFLPPPLLLTETID